MSTPKFREQPKGFATKAIHVGQDPNQWSSKCVIPPISLSTTFKQDTPAVYEEFDYSRSGNPTRSVLERCMAGLDNAKYGLTYSSGLGAITNVLALLSQGDHLLMGDDVYGGTNRLIRNVAARFGVEFSFEDPTNLEKFNAAIKPNTKLVWLETPTNPMMKVADIEAISKLCKGKEIIVAVDNTFLTSYFQRPLELGACLSCYSMTKYMNGHTDVVMGGITLNCDKLYARLKFLQNSMGVVPSPFDCYLVNRSLKTLALRMEQHQKNGFAVARYLEAHPYVERVLHPGLESHPQHKLTLKQTYGYSGVFSFYMKGGLKQSKVFLQTLKVFTLAESLGGFESLAELPSVMTHASVPEEDRNRLGITDSLIRLSVGIEDADDLIADIKNALQAAQDA